MNNRRWFFYFCAGIIFIDIFFLSTAGIYHLMLISRIDVPPLCFMLWTIISVCSFLYYEKHSEDFTKTEPGILQPSPFTQKLIFESQMDELKADLKLYLSVYEKQGEGFTEKDLEDFKRFREMLKETKHERQ